MTHWTKISPTRLSATLPWGNGTLEVVCQLDADPPRLILSFSNLRFDYNKRDYLGFLEAANQYLRELTRTEELTLPPELLRAMEGVPCAAS